MKNGYLERKIGFKWNEAVTESLCRITGEVIKPNIGYAPVLTDAKSADESDLFISPGLLSKYSVNAYIQWRGLCAQHPLSTGRGDSPLVVLSKDPLRIDAESTDLVEMLRSIATKVANGVVASTPMDPTVIQAELAMQGFTIKGSRAGENYAEAAVKKIMAPLLLRQGKVPLKASQPTL